MRHPPAMADVAKLAGVSHQTVSRVINGHPNVKESTRRRVQDAIDRLGYRPNVVAKYLAQRKSATLGIITVGDSIFGPTNTLLAIEEAAHEADYFISLAALRRADADVLRRAVDHFVGLSVAGVVAVAPEAGVADIVCQAGIAAPTVIIGNGVPSQGNVRATSIDQVAGARKVVSHLADLGHTDIAFIAGAPGWLDSIGRERGWREELAARGLPARPVEYGNWNAQGGYDVVRGWADVPRAIFAANDLIAIGAIRALHERGLRVPEDVAVAGFDNIPGAEMLIPALTTVEQDFSQLGTQVMRMLLAAIDGDAIELGMVDPRLIIRESTVRA